MSEVRWDWLESFLADIQNAADTWLADNPDEIDSESHAKIKDCIQKIKELIP